jgi:predicted nucleic acid-binding Zn ribbon protein
MTAEGAVTFVRDAGIPHDKQIRCSGRARALAQGGVVASRTCPICQEAPLTPRQRYCSGRCRANRSRQRKETRRERDAEIRTLLEAALKQLREDP